MKPLPFGSIAIGYAYYPIEISVLFDVAATIMDIL